MKIHFPDSFIEEIKYSNQLFDVIQDYTNFKKVSNRIHKAICPFHNEKTASFKYHENSGQAYCYGCGIHIGDSIDFIKEIENCDFQEAVKILAKRAGIELPVKKDDKYLKVKNIKKLLNKKANKFEKILFRSKKENSEIARKYLSERNIDSKTAKKWGIGFCDFSEKDSKQFKKFCNRITFSIFNQQGSVIGFSGRKLPTDKDNKYPKYINSSDDDNILFNKRKLLYGLNFAKTHIRKLNHAILVEGFTDVIMLNKIGIKNVVASMGTSITEEQIKKIKRYTDNIILFLDGDESGQRAMQRSIKTLKKEEINIKLIRGKNGRDPAEMAEKYKAKLVKWINKNTKTVEQYYIDKFMSQYESKIIDAKKDLIKDLSSVFNNDFSISEELALERVCKRLNLSIQSLSKKIKIRRREKNVPRRVE